RDWSSDVCSSDLQGGLVERGEEGGRLLAAVEHQQRRRLLQHGLHPCADVADVADRVELLGDDPPAARVEVELELLEQAAALGGVLGEVGDGARGPAPV